MSKTDVLVYPCRCPEGHHLSDPAYPAEEQTVTADLANWLVASKAFSYSPDGLHDIVAVDERAVYDPALPPILPRDFGVIAPADEASPAESVAQEV